MNWTQISWTVVRLQIVLWVKLVTVVLSKQNSFIGSVEKKYIKGKYCILNPSKLINFSQAKDSYSQARAITLVCLATLIVQNARIIAIVQEKSRVLLALQ